MAARRGESLTEAWERVCRFGGKEVKISEARYYWGDLYGLVRYLSE